jgi:hypothetical protein
MPATAPALRLSLPDLNASLLAATARIAVAVAFRFRSEQEKEMLFLAAKQPQ